MLSDENRGATMEAVVSRMKTVQKSIMKETSDGRQNQAMRIIAVSATIPNVDDVSTEHYHCLLRNRFSKTCVEETAD